MHPLDAADARLSNVGLSGYAWASGGKFPLTSRMQTATPSVESVHHAQAEQSLFGNDAELALTTPLKFGFPRITAPQVVAHGRLWLVDRLFRQSPYDRSNYPC